MTSIKAKFRPSIGKNNEGTIYYQIIHNRVVRQLKTKYLLYNKEWDNLNGELNFDSCDRTDYLFSIQQHIKMDIQHIENIILFLKSQYRNFTADDIIQFSKRQTETHSLYSFMYLIIHHLHFLGKYRTSEAYRTTLRSFMRFRENNDIMLHDINSDVIQMYEAYLHSCGITKNTCSFYMRILRAVYNRAVDQGLIQQLKAFRNVYTGVDKTVKRALSFDEIKEIKNLDLPHNSNLDFARDMFLFSFYTRGMSFIDMAYLKKKNLVNGMLKYYRHKTGQLLCIRWEECMQKIIDKYRIAETPYLLPIITKSNTNPRLQYLNTMRLINNHLKRLAKLLNLRIPLSMYVARHSWANIAHCKNIPIAVICEGMGHNSEKTTRIYLASLNNIIIDNANAEILSGL